MRPIMNVLVWTGAVVLFVVVCAVGIAFMQTYRTARRAEELLRIATKIQVGRATESATANVFQQFASASGQPEAEGNGDEYRSFIFDNRSVFRLMISKYRRFTIRFRFKNGILDEKGAEFRVDEDCRLEVIERAPPQDAASDYRNHFSTVPAGYGRPIVLATIIDDSSYPELLREADWAFNLRHLADLGGCRDARPILPILAK